jgi:hypothetical protein
VTPVHKSTENVVGLIRGNRKKKKKEKEKKGKISVDQNRQAGIQTRRESKNQDGSLPQWPKRLCNLFV